MIRTSIVVDDMEDEVTTKRRTAVVRKVAHAAALEKASSEPDHLEVWKCLDCSDAPEFKDFNAVKQHLSEVHKLDTSGKLEGTKQMTMHIDGAKWYASQYEIVLQGVHLSCYVRNTRDASTMMY